MVPELQLEKTASKATAGAGEEIIYTLTYRNVGTGTATAVMLTDDLPAETSFVSATRNGMDAGNTVTWDLGEVPPGSSGSVSVTAEVNAPIGNGIVMQNFASIDSAQTDPVQVGPVEVTATSAPRLEIAKQAPSTHVTAGQQFSYTITYGNSGTDTASGVTIEDTLPTGLSFVSASAGGTENNGTVTWNLPDLPPGRANQLSLTVQVGSPIVDGTVLSNDVRITSNQTGSVDAQTVDVTVDSNPVLVLEKTVSKSSAVPGDTLTYTLSWRNIGSDQATNVMLEDVLPPGTLFGSATGNPSVNGLQVSWDLGTVAAGAQGSVTLSAEVDSPINDGTTLHNTTSIQSAETPSPATAFADTVISSSPKLELVKSVSRKLARPGETLVYTIDYRNTGTDDATDVTLEDHLPNLVNFVSASGNYSESNGIITWDKGTLPAGSSGSVSVTVTVANPIPNGSILHNTATLDSNETNPVTADVRSSDVFVASEARLTIDIVASKAQANPGDSIVYQVTYGNAGTDLAGNAQLVLGLPPQVTVISSSAGALSNGNALVWNVGSLAAGSTGTVSATVAVASPLANGTRLNATASISDILNHFATDNTDTLINSAPVLRVSKAASRSVVSPDDTLVYTIHYENAGNDAASNVVLEDLLPPKLMFVSASGGGSDNGGVVDWNIGNLAAGSSGSVTLTTTVMNPLPNGTVIHNHATLDSTETSPVSTGQVDVRVSSAPRLTINKSVSGTTASPGDSVTYTIHYSNSGTDDATNVVIEDHLPPDLTFGQATSGGLESGGIVTWDIGTLAAGTSGSVSLSATVDTPLPNGTVLHNTATVNSTETTPLSTGNVDVTVTSAPQLALQKTASVQQATPGDFVTYSLAYANNGTDQATGALLEDHLPPDTAFVSASTGGAHSAGVVSWDLQSVPAGSAGSVTVTVQVNSPLANGTVLHNSATLSSNETPDVTPPVVDVLVSSAPLLALEKRASKAVASPDDTLVYTLDYRNSGTDQATNVVLEDHLPPEVSFLSATGGGNEAGGVVTWNLGTVPAGASGSVGISATVNNPLANGIVLHNSASLASSQTSAVSVGPIDVVVSSSPVLEVSKRANRATASPDEEIIYTIDFRNSGSDAATNVVLEDLLPSGVSFVSATASGGEANGLVTWNVPSLPAGASGSVSMTVTVDNPLPNGTILHNAVTASSTETAPVTSAVVDVTVVSAPVLEISKQASAQQVSAGSQFVYTIDFRNSGNDAATGVVIEDHLPPQASLVSASSGASNANGVVTWNLPNLPAGSAGSVSLTVEADSPLANGTILHNSASIDSAQTPPVGAINTITVLSAPALRLSAVAQPTTVVAGGGQYAITLEYGNIGNENAAGVQLAITIPPESSFVSATDGGSPNGDLVVWTIPALPAGATGSQTVVFSVPGAQPDGLVIPHASSVSTTGVPPLAGNLVAVTVQSSPAFELTKHPSSPVVTAGDLVTYEISYFNVGTDAATNVQITDTLPLQASFISASANGMDGGTLVSWDIGTVPAQSGGTVSVTLELASPLANGTVVSNQAEITSTETPPLSASGSFTVSSAPALALVKTSSPTGFVDAGKEVLYTLTLSNTGNDAAHAVVVTDNLPPTTSLALIAQGGQYDPVTHTVSWNIPSLAAGSQVELQYAVNIPLDTDNGTQISNLASARAFNAATVSDHARISVESQAVLELVKSGGNSVEGGQNLVYTLEYRNTGNLRAQNVVLQDLIPAGMTFVEASAGGVESGGVVTWELFSVGPGAGGSVTVTLQAPGGPADGTLFTNTASLTASNASSVTDSVVTVERTHVELDVMISGAPSPVPAGDPVNFLVNYANLGNADSLDTVLKATVPPNVTFVSASNGGSLVGNEVVWDLGVLAALGGGSVSFLVDVNEPLPNGTTVPSTATIEAPGAQSKSDTAIVVVSSAPLLIVSKTTDAEFAFTGSNTDFVIRIENLGNEIAEDVVVVDQLLRPLEAVAASDNGVISADRSSVTWTVGDVEPGDDPVELLVTARVEYFEPEVTNLAVISSAQTPDMQVSVTLPVIDVENEIPTLNEYMLALLALLMLGVGFIHVRRFA